MLVDLGDLFGMRDWRPAKEDGVYEAEHRRVRADAERERQQRDDRETGALAGAAEGEANVAGN